jgi:hypothetical protein
MDLLDTDRGEFVAVGWDDDPSHRLESEADSVALFAVLNGAQVSLREGSLTCTFVPNSRAVEITIRSEDVELFACAIPNEEYAESMIRTFESVAQENIA